MRPTASTPTDLPDASAARRGRRGSIIAVVAAVAVVASAVLAAAGSRYAPRTGPLPISAGPVLEIGRSPLGGTGALVAYSPHPDDETFGMAFQILRARAAGRTVYGVLLTDGEDSSAYEESYRADPALWTDADHDGVKGTRWDYALERRNEYVRAMARMGVPPNDLRFFGRAADPRHRGLADAGLTEQQVLAVAMRMAAEHPGATHIGTMGDMAADPQLADARAHPDHVAVARALRQLWLSTGTPVAFFKIYVFGLPWASRYAPVVEFDPLLASGKSAALAEYTPGTGPGRLGLGFESVRELLEAASLDPREFMVRPEDF